MAKEKNIEWLNEKWWYRLIKVMYFLVSGLISIIALLIIYYESDSYRNGFDTSNFLIYTIITFVIFIIVFDLIRRTFFYIVLGIFSPKEINCIICKIMNYLKYLFIGFFEICVDILNSIFNHKKLAQSETRTLNSINQDNQNEKGVFAKFTDWLMSKEEMEKQLNEYESLKFGRSYRSISTILVFINICIFILLNKSTNEYYIVNVFIFLFLALFTYLGKQRWAIFGLITYWTLSKAFQIYELSLIPTTSAVIYIVIVIFWFVFMFMFYKTFTVEDKRKQRLSPNNKPSFTGDYFFIFLVHGFFLTLLQQMRELGYIENLLDNYLENAFFICFIVLCILYSFIIKIFKIKKVLVRILLLIFLSISVYISPFFLPYYLMGNDKKVNTTLSQAYTQYSNKEYGKAIQSFYDALGYSEKNSFEYYLISGEIAAYEGDASLAKSNYENAYKLKPNDFRINNALGLFYLDLKDIAPEYTDYEKALLYAKKAYELSDTNNKNIVKQNLAIAYLFNNDYEQAISLLSTFNLKKEPFLAIWIGLAYLGKEDFDNARIYLQKAVDSGIEIPKEEKEEIMYFLEN